MTGSHCGPAGEETWLTRRRPGCPRGKDRLSAGPWARDQGSFHGPSLAGGDQPRSGIKQTSPCRRGLSGQKGRRILANQLSPQICDHPVRSKPAQILVEVAKFGQKYQGQDP